MSELAEQILDARNDGDISSAALEQTIAQYPYFAPAYWWLARKSRETADGGKSLGRASLFSCYPLLLRVFVHAPVLEGPGGKDKTDALIQPLYAEDYFAYAGVKLSDTAAADGKKPTMAQLLSFTDWLRTLKRPQGAVDPDLQPEEREAAMTRENQASGHVKAMADSSVASRDDVVTEAMAEVRIRQGQPARAIAIYEKLSLLNPGKKSYFAAKIESLKKAH
ncbi:hypothetical protein [Compostibacter hankyongensis]|uniref:Tetratricopeptide repeat protein n=1 Tax=Compostibacter hankyongensis TaxID=1007089 RepID=A0ABP8FVQ1_9BACT